jgi:hypothetical protein
MWQVSRWATVVCDRESIALVVCDSHSSVRLVDELGLAAGQESVFFAWHMVSTLGKFK